MLIDTGVEPTRDIGEWFEEVLIADELHGVEQGRCHNNISQGDLIVDQVCLVHQILFKDTESGRQIGLGFGVAAKKKS